MKRAKSQMRIAVAFITLGVLKVLLWSSPVLATDPSLKLAPPAGTEPRPLVASTPIRLPLVEGKGIRVTHLSTEQGLSESRVDHMLQDRRGFIWIGTLNGLSRYDGYRFKTYKPDPNNPNSLGGLRVFALFEDRSGILWIGVDQELDRFDPVTETFTHFRADPDNPDSPSGYLEHMTQDRDGMLWLATRNGLDRLDPASGRFTHYRNAPNDPHSLTSNDVRFVLEDRQGTLWVANGAGLDAFDSRTGHVLRNYPSFQQPPLDRILEDRSGTLWASATRGGGLASLDRKTGVFTRYIWFEGWPGTPGVRGCAAILEDQRGMLWLATKSDGLVRFDRARRLFTRYRNNPVNPASLNNNDALSLLEDREGGIWVGTNGGGVNRFPSEPLPFTVFRNEPGNPNSLEEGNVLSVSEDGRGILWIGTTSQLNRLDKKTGQYTFYRHDPANSASIATGVVRATVEDRAGYLWFGTWGGGLNRFDRGTGRFKAYRHDPADAASLSHDYVLSLLLDHEGSLWAGTDDGLNRLDARTGHFTHFRWKTGSIESRWYPVLAEGADGSIWMGTYTQGLQRLDVRTGEIVAYQYDPKVPGSLSNNQVHALCVDHAGTLWVGTQNGLDRFDSTTRKFTTPGERDGLPNNAVEGILEDSAGNLWLSTSNGLSRFNPQTLTFKNYFADDGLAGDEFNDFSVYYKSASGEMFFGGVNGVTAFYPEKVVDRPFVPTLVLTDFRLFNDPVPVGGRSPLKRSITYTDSFTLSHAQNIFALEFSALSFANPTRMRYRYRLEDLETHWNEATASQRVVTYTTLPAGQYHFRVQSKDNRGEWSEPGLTVAIRVLPAWWNTWQFRTVWITSLLLLLWFVYQFRVHQIQRQSKQLRDVIDTIPGNVWSALPDGAVDFINQRWLEFSGVSLEKGLGWGWEVAVHPEDRIRFAEEWRAAVACGKPMETEARVRRADGQYRWLLIRNVPLHDERGKIVKWYGTSTDIDDRKRAEEALCRLNRELRAISNCNQILLRATDEQSLLEEICRIVCEEAGYRIAWVAYAEHDEAKTVRPVGWAGAEEGYLATAGVTWADTERGRGPTGTAMRSGKTCYIQDFAKDPRMAPWRDRALQRGFRSGIGLPLKDEHDNTFGSLTIHSSQPNAFTPEEIRLLEELAADLAFGIVTLRSQAARKQAEEALRESETRFRTFVDHAADALFIYDFEQGTIVDVNRQACESLGYTPQELIGKRALAFHLDSDRAQMESVAQRAAAGETVIDTHWHRRKDGTLFPVEAHTSQYWYGGRRFLLKIARDISDRLRAEEKLRRSEAYLTEGQRLSHTGSFAWSTATRQTTYWSEEQFRIFGLNPQDGLPSTETFWQRIHPEDLDQTRELLLTAAERTMEYEHDHRIVLPDGTVKHIHAIGHPVLDENGHVIEYVGTAFDVTERKRAEEERERLRQLEADLAHINRVSMLGELAASIAHEVNQPLSGVVSNGSACLRWLAGDPPNVDEARENARRVIRDGKRAGEVIARIRALTKRAATPRQKLDLNKTIQDVLDLVGDEANKKSVIIRTRFADEDLPPVSGDRVQLQQVMLNLVINAIEAMSSVRDRARELVITTQAIHPDQVQVTVEDSGTGIDPQKIDRIFDSFYTTKPGGMGMGLSISRSILQAHGGRLWATAKDGIGTIFSFTLPRYHEEEANAGVAAV